MTEECAGMTEECAGMTEECAGMTEECAGMTEECAGMTEECAGMTEECAGMTEEWHPAYLPVIPAKAGRVAAGGCPPAAPTDPGVPNSGTRLVR